MSAARLGAALGVAGAAGLLLWLWRSSSSSPGSSLAPTVYYRDRAAGIHPRLVAYLDWWTRHGPFPVGVGANGGLRTDEAAQAELYRTGRSKARTLAETPHGRGCAVDLYPVELVDARARFILDELDPRWRELGAAAESQGLVWGGRWTSLVDRPHVELPSWRSEPVPPRYT